ncbi:MAG: hypothetical protein V1735_02520 [Nanoarchaeota archaeon]
MGDEPLDQRLCAFILEESEPRAAAEGKVEIRDFMIYIPYAIVAEKKQTGVRIPPYPPLKEERLVWNFFNFPTGVRTFDGFSPEVIKEVVEAYFHTHYDHCSLVYVDPISESDLAILEQPVIYRGDLLNSGQARGVIFTWPSTLPVAERQRVRFA